MENLKKNYEELLEIKDTLLARSPKDRLMSRGDHLRREERDAKWLFRMRPHNEKMEDVGEKLGNREERKRRSDSGQNLTKPPKREERRKDGGNLKENKGDSLTHRSKKPQESPTGEVKAQAQPQQGESAYHQNQRNLQSSQRVTRGILGQKLQLDQHLIS